MLTWVLLCCFVLNLGIAFGAGIYEHRIVLPQWLVGGAAAESARPVPEAGAPRWNRDAAHSADTGRRFWVWVTTVPLTLLTLASLYVAWRMDGGAGRWWRAAAGLALADRVLTFTYFIPTMVTLLGSPQPADAAGMALRWVAFNHVRHALVLAAWLAGMRAFALMAART